ncbi:hybrid sensor histidine kinase/response regulator [Butyrivibrio sp. LC3010]|uniref:hybrid sensor histidine kinase/response regulator n=1 Tax=Butyrivibrio sp. LC3010 TaxID=1280680 RepID=UPI00047ACAAA|nr:response regulator [Butyrivibrio sp. LC3010]
MDKLGRDRFILVIMSIGCLGLSIESAIESWELWLSVPMILGILGLWIIHVTQMFEANFREAFYFIFGVVATFFYSMRMAGFINISIIIIMMLTIFSLLNKFYMLNCILGEFFLITVFHVVFIVSQGNLKVNVQDLSRLVLQIMVVLSVFFVCRRNVKGVLLLEESKSDSDQKLKANQDDMDDFLTSISHELRTPVNIINGMSELIRKRNHDEEIIAINDAGVRLSHQIEDIQDYIEIKRGDVILSEDNYEIVSLINDMLERFKQKNADKQLELIVDFDPRIPTLLNGDVKRLKKIFIKLMDNAQKFTEVGGIYVRVYSSQRDYGINLIIQITDTGMGMSRRDIAAVAKGAHRVNKKRTRSSGGIGLGLPVVYGFVHKMGGFVKIQSAKGRGTTVQISVPQRVVDSAECIKVDYTHIRNVLIYLRNEKYEVPELRDYYKNMAQNISIGLKLPLVVSGTFDEAKRYIERLDISHIFIGEEEYLESKEYFDAIADDGIAVAVVVPSDRKPEKRGGITFMPKPIYGYPIARILNNELQEYIFASSDNNVKTAFEGVRTLIVDDEPANLIVAKAIFEEYGMITDTAGGGADAIEKYKNGNFDLIFMDHMMPGMDGVECMKRIRADAERSGKHPIIIVLTANTLSGAQEMFKKEGFDGFLAKPIDTNEFESVMKKKLPESRIGKKGGDLL